MRWNRILAHPLAAFAPSLAILAAFLVAAGSATLAPHGLFPRPAEMLGYLVLGTLAALHRPHAGTGAGLGLATLVLPAALLRLGAVPAAFLAGMVDVAACSWRYFAGRRSAAERETPWHGRNLENAVLLVGAVLLAGAVSAGAVSAGAVSAGAVSAGAVSAGAVPAGGVAAPVPATLGGKGLAPAATYLAALFLLLLIRQGLLADEGPSNAAEWKSDALALAVPLLVDAAGWTVGVLLHDVAVAGGWGRSAAVMAALALAAAEAARNARLRREAELRIDDLERLQHAHKRILAEISGMGGIAQQILTECRNILPVQWYQFELLRESPQPPQASGARRSWAAGPEGVLFEGDPRPDARPRVLPGVHRRVSWTILEKELRAEGETLAVVRLWCDPRRIEPGAEELFVSLLPQMASSVHRAQLDREAKLDPLTGVPVRRLLESRLQKAYRDCMDEGRSMAVILCDIDHFKQVNDTHGHAAGDEALKLFARTLDTHRREQDLCCRYGGEEFTLLLENTNGDAALGLAERLRAAVGALEFHYGDQLIPLTFSAGVAAFPELHIKTASELLLLADEALYEAKEQGRNRCLLHVGRGAFRAPTGQTLRTHDAPDPPQALRLFG